MQPASHGHSVHTAHEPIRRIPSRIMITRAYTKRIICDVTGLRRILLGNFVPVEITDCAVSRSRIPGGASGSSRGMPGRRRRDNVIVQENGISQRLPRGMIQPVKCKYAPGCNVINLQRLTSATTDVDALAGDLIADRGGNSNPIPHTACISAQMQSQSKPF